MKKKTPRKLKKDKPEVRKRIISSGSGTAVPLQVTKSVHPGYEKIIPGKVSPAVKPTMTEEFLRFVWQYRLFDNRNLTTSDGDPVEIFRPGDSNTDSGPDFSNARIRIGQTTWAGNVEIHVNASDWLKHHHSENPSYKNTILHVVYKNDRKVKRNDAELLPALELKDKFDPNLFHRYTNLVQNKSWIPCERQIRGVDNLIIHQWIDRLSADRLERRTLFITQTLEDTSNNWNESFYRHLARNFGFKVNSEPFQVLARSLPLNLVAKHKDNADHVEALYFGQAGLLEGEFRDDYPNRLKKEYDFLRQKYGLRPIPAGAVQWKFMRLRPFNFPTVRIAQFSNLMMRSSNLFPRILEANDLRELSTLFDITASPYWNNHFIFDTIAPGREKRLGTGAANNILINTAIPFLFVYGKKKQINQLCNKAIDFLSKIPGEENEIIDRWKIAGMPVKNAFCTQALLELKNEYCDKRKCLSCSIGSRIIRGNRQSS
ncbi:MAG: DUF2851 family protein [Bacteroidetes bacterium]|nr:DUF2851 family protein [Bacteroidota bacterium]